MSCILAKSSVNTKRTIMAFIALERPVKRYIMSITTLEMKGIIRC